MNFSHPHLCPLPSRERKFLRSYRLVQCAYALTSLFLHVEENRFILSLEPNIKTIDKLAILFFASGNQCSTPALVFDGRQHRVALICRLITKINSCISVHEHATRKNCDIDMRSLYGCVRTRDSPWFDGFE